MSLTEKKKEIWVSKFVINNAYMKFQNPSIHVSKDMRGLKSVTYGWPDRWMNKQMDGWRQTSSKQHALPNSSVGGITSLFRYRSGKVKTLNWSGFSDCKNLNCLKACH